MYKEALQQKLRFITSKGSLTIEQLWDLTPVELDTLAVSLDIEYKESGKKSFLTTRSVKDKTTKLRFDIVLDILQTKLEEAEITRAKSEDKEHNKKILNLIAEKDDETLKGKSKAQLEKLLR